MGANRREFLLGAAVVAAGSPLSPLARTFAKAQMPDGESSPFLLETAGGGLTSLRFAGDPFPTNYVATGQALGDVDLTWRRDYVATGDARRGNIFQIHIAVRNLGFR